MRSCLLVIAAVLAIAAGVSRSSASIQAEMLCWEPDIEFPVPCEDDD